MLGLVVALAGALSGTGCKDRTVEVSLDKAIDYRDVKTGTGSPAKEGNPALEGARLVLRSPYLLSVVAIVGLYEIVSTVMDFQFTSTIAHYLEGEAIGRQFATVFAITNVVSLLVQLLLTSFVMTRFGVGIALLVLPRDDDGVARGWLEIRPEERS